MLYLFGPKETDFINGDSDLIHHTYDEVVDRSKGFYLKFKVALDKDERYKDIKKEMIISAYTPDGWNQFRVFDIYNHTNHVEVVATQLHYDLNYKKVFPFVVNRTTAQTALNVFVQNFKSDLPNFKFTSNINDVHSFSTDDDLERLDEGHNALEILNRIASRWGGELKVDGYNVHLTHKLGKFTNALLYEHKNISEFVDETSMSEIITRIHAVSRFRPEREEGSSEEPEEVTIKVVVDSPLINEYAQVYEEDYTNNDARTRDQLIAWARLKYTTNNIDKPARSINVETNIIDGQEINYGDDLVLKYTKHDVDEIIRCVGYQYNPNSRQYISVTLGSNLNSLASTITGSVHDSTKNQLSNIEKQVQIIKYAASNSNRVTTGPLPIPDPIEGDMWYYHPDGRPNDVELRIFQDGGWVTIVSDMTGDNVRRAIAELETGVEGLVADIIASDKKAAAAKDEAGLAKSAVDAFGIITQETAGKMVDVEQIVADAESNATDALAKARESATNSSGALALAGQAATDAATAISDAQTALTTAGSAESSVSTLSKEVDTVAGKVVLKADQTEVDTVKGTVSSHTSTLSQHAKDISARLTQTQVDNLVSGKGYSTVSYVDSEMTATASAIRTEMTAVEGKIPTSIGGRNLYPKTSNEWAEQTFAGWQYYLHKIPIGEDENLRVGDEITWSGILNPAKEPAAIMAHFLTNTGGYIQWQSDFIPGGDAGKVVGHAVVPSNAVSLTLALRHKDGDVPSDKVRYKELKIEKGDIATDWSPAPEDTMMQNDFNVFKASYDQSAKGWSAKLTQIEQAGYATKTWSNQTFATPSSINTTLQSYAKTSALNGLATETYVGSQLSATAGTIRSEITAVKGMIPTQIGGRNLVKGTTDEFKSVTFNVWNYYVKKNISAKGDTYYTLSARVIKEYNNQGLLIFEYNSAGVLTEHYTDSQWYHPIHSDMKNSFTIKTKPDTIRVDVGIRNNLFAENRFKYREFQLEQGDVATDWSPAPEDMATTKQVSSIEQKANSIQALVGTTKESVARAVMTSNLWETEVSKVIDSELEQEFKYVDSPKPYHTATASRSISKGTNVIDTYLPLGSDGVINGSRLEVDIEYEPTAGSKGNPVMSVRMGDAKSVNVTVYHSMRKAKFHLFIPQNTVHGDVLKLNTSIANAGTNRWGYLRKITVSTVKRLEVPIDGTNTGAISSKITQLYDMINLSVLGKEGALSRIAMGEEGIQIDGKLLHITAKTFIDNAVIKSAMIDTLDAGKITTGTLNATNVNVINLDANSISGNEASFIRAMFTNRNSALQITGTGITVSKSNGNRTFEVDSSGVTFYSDTGPGAYISTHNVVTWNGSSWVDSGANSVLFASELRHSIGIGYKILTNGKYMTRDAIRLDRSGTGVPELQVNLPIKNIDYQRGRVSGENGTYFRNTQDTAGIWMGDNGKLILITYGKLYNSTTWLNP